MASPLLLLPRELRDQIYNHAFSSPTGFVVLSDEKDSLVSWTWRRHNRHLTIHPYDPKTDRISNSTLNFSLLRVCKQIHAECNIGIFWERNALSLVQVEDLQYFIELNPFAWQLRTRLQHIQIPLNVHKLPYLDDLAKTLEILVTWSHTTESSLKTLDLRFGNKAGLHFLYVDPIVQKYVSVLKAIRGEIGLAKCVKKRLILEIPPILGDLGQEWRDAQGHTVRERALQKHRPLLMLHNALQGELWVDGLLYYKDGVKVKHKSDNNLQPEEWYEASKPVEHPRSDCSSKQNTPVCGVME